MSYETFDLNESQARVDADLAFWDAIQAELDARFVDNWGDKWDRLYSDDAMVLAAERI